MDSKILKYFKKNHIQIEDIKYLTRVDGKTCIHTMDNQTFLTYITIKDFFESLELHDFICVNKGIVVAKNQINYIADGIYHMLDGAEFQGRKRTAAAHKKLNATLHQSIADSIAVLAKYTIHTFFVFAIAFKCADTLRDASTSGIGMAGHDRCQCRSKGAAFIAVVWQALRH